MLAKMKYPEFPVAVGIIRQVDRPTYNDEVERQIKENKKENYTANSLFTSGETWTVS
jgi:2-oxoglutarate ferredoxin oxidoreductase subunit beta